MKTKSRPPVHHLTFELALVVVAKIVGLLLIWWLLFSPHSRPDASTDAIAHRLAPASTSTSTGQP
jgi:hypothetical protein